MNQPIERIRRLASQKLGWRLQTLRGKAMPLRVVWGSLKSHLDRSEPIFHDVASALAFDGGRLFRIRPDEVASIRARELRAVGATPRSEAREKKALDAVIARFRVMSDAPPIVVIDDFYPDPDQIRRFALQQRFVPYNKTWFTSELFPLLRKDCPIDRDWLLRRFEAPLGVALAADYPRFELSTWQGAFHYKVAESIYSRSCSIHNHVNDSFSGYNAVVGLWPGQETHTTVWRLRDTDKCVSTMRDNGFDSRRFQLCLKIPLKYNRCLLFRNDLLHRGEVGFGTTKEDARMFQTFLGLELASASLSAEEAALARQEARASLERWLRQCEKSACDPSALAEARALAVEAGILGPS